MKKLCFLAALMIASAVVSAQTISPTTPCLTPAQVETAYASDAPNSAARAGVRQLVLGGIVCSQYNPKLQALVTYLVNKYGN